MDEPRAGAGGREDLEEIGKSDLVRQGRRSASRSRTPSRSSPPARRRCSGAGSGCGRSIRAALPPDFDLGLFPFPAVMPGGTEAGAQLGRDHADASTRKSKNPDLAFEMIKAHHRRLGQDRVQRQPGHLAERPDQRRRRIAYQMQSLKDPLYPEFLKLQPTGTTRVIFTPPVEEALYQGMQALFTGQQDAEAGHGGGRGGLAEGRRAEVHRWLSRCAARRAVVAPALRGVERNVTATPSSGRRCWSWRRSSSTRSSTRCGSSFHEWNGFTPQWGPFVGLDNYLALAGDEVFWKAALNSILFVVVRTPLEVGIAFGLALLLNQQHPRPLAAAHAVLRPGRDVADRGDDPLPAHPGAEHRPAEHVPAPVGLDALAAPLAGRPGDGAARRHRRHRSGRTSDSAW